MAVSLLAMLAVLVPAKSTFAKAETSSANRGENNVAETGTVKQENNGEQVETDTTKQENNEGEKTETGTVRQQNNDGENEAENHRSAVSSFVKNLLETADKNKNGVGEEVRAVAQEQKDADVEVSKEIDEVQNRSALKTFLIGTDYKNIGMIRSEMVKTQNRIDKLNRLLETMPTSTDKVSTTEQLQNLTQAQTKLEDFLKTNESKFSLFGWFVKLFNK